MAKRKPEKEKKKTRNKQTKKKWQQQEKHKQNCGQTKNVLNEFYYIKLADEFSGNAFSALFRKCHC